MRSSLHGSLLESSSSRRSRDEGKFTDLILSHGAGRFEVHQIIVCTQSRVFHKACTGGFEVEIGFLVQNITEIVKQETFTGVIEVADVSYLELKKMVDFFYSMDYDDGTPEVTEQEAGPRLSLLQLHARMFALGDRYDIPGLRDMAVKKYSSRCAVSQDPLELLGSVCDVYRRTPGSIRQLRNATCILIRKKLPKMLEDEAAMTVYEMVLSEIPEFTKDLLGIFVKAPLCGDCSTCGSNQAFEALQVRCKRCGKGSSSFHLYS